MIGVRTKIAVFVSGAASEQPRRRTPDAHPSWCVPRRVASPRATLTAPDGGHS
jgi:hypothetical protein